MVKLCPRHKDKTQDAETQTWLDKHVYMIQLRMSMGRTVEQRTKGKPGFVDRTSLTDA